MTAAGAIVYSTYIPTARGRGNCIAVDATGSAVVVGNTLLGQIPRVNPIPGPRFGNFALKLAPDGQSLRYSTLTDGPSESLGLDAAGNAYVAGKYQRALPLIGTALSADGETQLFKLSPTGALLASTRVGGDGSIAGAIAVDRAGNVYLAGEDSGGTLTTVDPVQGTYGGGRSDAFVIKINPALDRVLYATYLGGRAADAAAGIGVTPEGDVIVTGGTSSADFPSPSGTAGLPAGPFLATFVARISLTAPPPPAVTVTGVSNAADFQRTLAPGALATVFGTGFTASAVSATSVPFPETLGGVSVSVDGRPARVFFAGPTQVNFQIPIETSVGTSSLTMSSNGTASNRLTFPVAAAAPGIFQYGTNRAIVQNGDGSLNSGANPAATGSAVVAYLTGVGVTTPPVPNGAASPAEPLSVASGTARLGSQTAQMLFLGLTPGFVGLAQANLIVPDLPPGDYPLTITIGGQSSQGAVMSVRR